MCCAFFLENEEEWDYVMVSDGLKRIKSAGIMLMAMIRRRSVAWGMVCVVAGR